MKIQIKNISSHQTGKVLSITLACLTSPLILVGIFGLIFASDAAANSYNLLFWVFTFAPIVYGVVGYLIIRVFCLLYNVISQQVGGIEFVTDDQLTH